MRLILAIPLIIPMLFASASFAQTPPPAGPGGKPTRGPTLAVALDLAQGALAACAAKGFPVSVAIADQAGNTKVALVADNTMNHASAAIRKAATAAVFKEPGSKIAAQEKTDPALAVKIAGSPLYSDHPGSLPLLAGGEVIGGIGVGGAPSHPQDEACAQAAIDKYGSEIK